MYVFRKNIYRNVSTFEKLENRIVVAICAELEKLLLFDARNDYCTMKTVNRDSRWSTNFSSGFIATNVKFHHTNMPVGNHAEAKFLLQWKTSLLQFQNKCFIALAGLSMHASMHHQDSRADTHKFRQEL